MIAPTIAYAENGHPVAPVVAQAWARSAGRFLPLGGPEYAGWGATFAPGGKTPAAGERWASPGHAKTLRALVERGVRDFPGP